MKNLVDSLLVGSDRLTVGPYAVVAPSVSLLVVVANLDATSVDVDLLGYDPIADETFSILTDSLIDNGIGHYSVGPRARASSRAASLVLPSIIKVGLTASGGNTSASVSLHAVGLAPNASATAVLEEEGVLSTVVLLHFDGVDEATATVDELGHSVAFFNTAQLDTDQNKFGTASLLVAPDDGVRISSLDPAGATWTIEGFVRFAHTDGVAELQLFDSGFQYEAAVRVDGTTNEVKTSVIGADLFEFIDDAAAETIDVDTWYHVALVKDGSTYSTYFNGARVFTDTNAAILTTEELTQFDVAHLSTGTGNVWWDEVRYAATAVYSGASFTPPAAPFEVN